MSKKNFIGTTLLDDAHLIGRNTTADLSKDITAMIQKSVQPPRPDIKQPVSPQASPSKLLTARSTGTMARHKPTTHGASKTLKSMMHEYNRAQPTTRSTSRPTSRDFQYDEVDLIRVDAIPGKILRPR